MPELPEVEFAARTLRRLALGRRVVRLLVDGRARRLFRPGRPWALARALAGARLAAVDRRGKQLLLTFDGAAGTFGVVSHLGMTGKWEAGPRWRPEAGAAAARPSGRRTAEAWPPAARSAGSLPGVLRTTAARATGPRTDAAPPAGAGATAGRTALPPHVRAALLLDDGTTVHYDDPRMFGRLRLVPAARFDRVPEVAALGPDPVRDGIAAASLAAALAACRRPVKVALLDQGLLAGIGNIHAAEACWRARLDPRRRSDRLTPREVAALVRGLRATLRFALSKLDGPDIEYIEEGGDNPFHAYGREGSRCRHPGCGGAIRRIVQAQRSTYYCPGCQR
jgi:formamidopyrimidine-DNA glycosylase